MAMLTTDYQKIGSIAQFNINGATYYTNLYAKYSRTSSQQSNNKSTIHIKVTESCSQSSSAYSVYGTFVGTLTGLMGNSYSVQTTVRGGTEPTLFEHSVEVTHATDGSLSSAIGLTNVDGPYGNPQTLNQISISVPQIPRYANITSFSVSKLSETSVKYNYSADATLNYAWYSTDAGSTWHDLPVNNIVTGLSANTTYNFKLRVRREDSQLTTDSSVVQQTTYDYPHITTVNTNNLIIGNKQKLTLYNPLSRSVTVKMNKDSNSGTQFYSGTTSSTSIEFTPTASTLYASIPNAKSGKCVYSVVYSSSTKTTSQYTYTINEANCKPAFSNFAYADTEDTITPLTNNNQILVDNNSDCKFTISTSNKAVAKNSASITKYKFEWGSKSSEATYSASTDVTSTIYNSTGNTLKVTAIDSRGLSTTVTKTITNISYVSAVVNEVTATRSNGVESKTYLSGKFTIWNGNWQNGSNTDYDNQLKYIGYRVYDGSNWTSYFDITDKVKSAMSNYSNSNYTTITLPVSAKLEIHANGSSGGFTIGKSYTIQILIKDGNSSNIFTPYSYQATLQGSVTDGRVGMSRYKDSDGNYHYGINGMPSSDCTVTVKGNINADGDVNLISGGNAVNINCHKGILRHWTNDTQICANDGVIYLRPKGNENVTNQVVINNNGSVTANKFNGQVITSTGGSYCKARDNATVLNNRYGQSAGNAFNVVASQKTSLGAWSIGNLSGYEELIFSYNTDTNYKNNSNTCSVTKLPITGGIIQCKPTSLYNNSTGTTGTVTLSDSAANYSYLEIFVKNNDNFYQSVKVADPNNKNVSLTTNTQVGEILYLKNKTILISGKSISTVSNYYSQVQINASLQLGYSKSNLIYIVKVLGYK